MAALGSLITVEDAARHVNTAGVRFLDATWCMPGEEEPLIGQFITGALHFDIDQVADRSSPMAHMLPPSDEFAEALSEMGISNDDHLIIYDRHGVRAAPRVWWMLRMIGHQRLSIMNGGLPAWIQSGYAVTDTPLAPETDHYKANEPLSGVIDIDTLISKLADSPQIADARGAGRFYGTEPEPRAGLRAGHIPGSCSLPYGSLVAAGFLRPLTELAEAVGQSGIDLSKPIITSCGSGVTAAGLAFVMHLLGQDQVSVYDGSWTEWGAFDAPVETD